ncbi:hypothetical protein E2C01_010532 [Portunus trituberculatus]|uniref:Uncharacterized protein n=1 Tax=Portunus trituberculatus TaxID=210409 RepID=A0A5B7D8M6_PORTR|nr:hypothetical protein [Portunus trituberculatus]
MDVNARNYTWSESHIQVCQMCDMGEDESLECERYQTGGRWASSDSDKYSSIIGMKSWRRQELNG